MPILHKSLVPSETHHPFSFIFDSESQRTNANVTQLDLWKFALQSNNNSIWWLVKVTPTPVWLNIALEGTKSSPIGLAGGDLSGSYPNPSVIDNSHNHTPGVTIPAYPTTLPPNGIAGGDLAGNYPNPTIKPTGVTPGTYTLATFTVDNKGRITNATSNTVPTPSFNNVSLTGNSTTIDVQYGDSSLKIANTNFVSNSIQSEILDSNTTLIISLNSQKTISKS